MSAGEKGIFRRGRRPSGARGRSGRGLRTVAVHLMVLGLLATAQAAHLTAAAMADGGDFSLDFIAAHPGTYDHETGEGGQYDGRSIGTAVVESLEGGDFTCDDVVVFFTAVTVDGDAPGAQDVDLDFSWSVEPTGQPGAGFTDLLEAEPNAGDSGMATDGGEAVSIVSETTGSRLRATVRVTDLEAGERFILRLEVLLGCRPGSHPTGNLQAALAAARVVAPADQAGRIPSGQQTIPLKKVEDIARPGIEVDKSCPGSAAVGDTITYTITVTNTGNEPLTGVTVRDSVLGDLSGSFPDSLAVGESVTREFRHTVALDDPDPLENTVTASAVGAHSGETVTDAHSCATDVTHVPGIEVDKSCPGSAGVGDAVTYTITVTNTGNEPLTDLTVRDSLLGDLSGSFPGTLGVGESVTRKFERRVAAADPDPLQNSVTASAKGADSGDAVTDGDSCTTDVTHVPGIDVEKSCPSAAGIGDIVTYTITVTNTGNEPLEDVRVVDSVLGDLSASFADTLAVGASETREFEHAVSAEDPDPVENVVVASAVGADSGEDVSDTDRCLTDVTHTPGIDVEKTCPSAAPVGSTISYTITVTNTGDEPLRDVTVLDTLLGDLSGAFSDTLGVGQSESQTFSHLIGTDDPDPLKNVVTASAVGADSAEDVFATARCVTDLGGAPGGGEEGGPLPFTGFDARPLLALGLLLLLTGGGLLRAGSREPSAGPAGGSPPSGPGAPARVRRPRPGLRPGGRRPSGAPAPNGLGLWARFGRRGPRTY